ncbi:MAG: hypothetical protein H7175_03950 [Burkholderiales bacterium]|nr:hypothetical protein [Anaerolineae bacterium]
MLRRTTQAQFSALVRAARERVPNVNITTDVIVGFPGETDAEFETSAAFIADMDFAGMHVFRYSKRPETAAARMRGHIAGNVAKKRSARLLALAAEQERRFTERNTGQTLPVLWEQVAGSTPDGFNNVGYTDNYIRVSCIHPRALTNLVTLATLQGYDEERGQMRVAPIIGGV